MTLRNMKVFGLMWLLFALITALQTVVIIVSLVKNQLVEFYS